MFKGGHFMKYWGITVFILVACMPALGAGVNEYEFVSALSVPEASFQAVETKSVDHPTKFGANTVFNVGAPSTGDISGDINVKGNPIQVETLNMNNSTSVANSANTKWLVDTLNIRTGGKVEVGTLLAEQIDLQNTDKSKETTLQVNNKLQTDTNTWAKDGEIKKTGTTEETLQADWKDGTDNKQFHFVPGTATGTAKWKDLPRTSHEGTKNHPVDTRFYPIYTTN